MNIQLREIPAFDLKVWNSLQHLYRDVPFRDGSLVVCVKAIVFNKQMAFDLNVFYVKDLYCNIVESQNKKCSSIVQLIIKTLKLSLQCYGFIGDF